MTIVLEQGRTPREELELLNDWRAAWHLPRFAGYRHASGRVTIGWEPGSEPLYEIAGGADGIFYRDLREPHIVVDESAITITTAKALWAPARTILPANYWRVGKAVKLTVFGKCTSGATPGNLTFSIGYGSGDNPTPLVSATARAWTASQTNATWYASGYAECRSIGATGTLRMWAIFNGELAAFASTVQPMIAPASAPADSTIDTTVGTNALTLQAARSGSTSETMTVTNLQFEAIN